MILLLVFFSALEGTYSQFNQTPTFSAAKAISPWIELGKLIPDGPVAHYPDIYDEFSDLPYGFPNRIIEIAQLGHGRPVINGRDAQQFKSGCGKLPRLDSYDGLKALIDSGVQTIVIHRRFIEINELNESLKVLKDSPDLIDIGNLMNLSRDAGFIDTGIAISLSLDAEVFKVTNPEPSDAVSDCRSPNETRVDTSVSGATHGLEINGNGRFWWQNGDSSTVDVTVSFDGPVLDKRVFLRFIPNPCYVKTDLRVHYSDVSGYEKETFVSINQDQVSMLIHNDLKYWWRPLVIRVDFPKTSCTLSSDPRNLGVGIREAVLE
jgi:hypothetical protein